MVLEQQIEADFTASLKAQDETKVSTLRMLKSALKNSEIQKGSALEDSDIIGVLQKEVKYRQESIELYKKGNRPELAQKEEKEIAILKNYLPAQMDEAKIKEIVQKAIAETGAFNIQDMGKVMAKVMPELKGQADGQTVSKITQAELNK